MLLWQRGIPSRRRDRFSSAPLSSVLASDAQPTTVSCRRQSRTFLAGQSGCPPRLPRTVGKIAPPHGAGTLPWRCQNNPSRFSFPASVPLLSHSAAKATCFRRKTSKNRQKRRSRYPAPGMIFHHGKISACFLMSLSNFYRNKQKHMRNIGQIAVSHVLWFIPDRYAGSLKDSCRASFSCVLVLRRNLQAPGLSISRIFTDEGPPVFL